MKVKIKECFGELPEYLTMYKLYEVFDYDKENDFGYIIDDTGYEITFKKYGSAHLNYGSWEVVNE